MKLSLKNILKALVHITDDFVAPNQYSLSLCLLAYYPRRARSALGVDIVLTLDVCLYVTALERKRLIGMT